MIKKLCILLLSVCTVAPMAAQQYSSGDASFAPKKGQWQISAVIGSNTMFNQNMEYLLPKYWNGNGEAPNISLGNNDYNETGNASNDPGMYLNLGNLNTNNLVNLIGIQGKYFLTDRWDVNLMFSMNINATPKKDYIAGDKSVPDMAIPAYNYVEGKISNMWSLAAGSNYYFNTKNERINLYVGGVFGWQMGRIETVSPYTGETVSGNDTETTYQPITDANGNIIGWDEITESGNWTYSPHYNGSGEIDYWTKVQDTEAGEDEEDPLQLYVPSSKAGRIFSLRVGGVAGIEYSLAKGLVFGFEVQPISYRYDQIQIIPKGMQTYKVGHHNVNFFATPNIKIGFRF